MTSQQTLVAYSHDADYQLISKQMLSDITKFVNSKNNLSTFDFSNLALVEKVLGLTDAQYAAEMQTLKAAGQRFVKRWNLGNKACATCGTTTAQKLSACQTLFSGFQTTPASFSKFGKTITTDYSIMSTTEGPQAGLCCGAWFYACCALAAETIEIFPVYLAACAYCYHAECCVAKNQS